MKSFNSFEKVMDFSKRISGSNWRFLLTIIPSLFLFILLIVSLNITTFDSFHSYTYNRVTSLFFNQTLSHHSETEIPPPLNSSILGHGERTPNKTKTSVVTKKEKLDRSRIAVCLVGGARRFELTGPSIVEYILKPYPNADLFLHSPLDGNSFKFSLLKVAPRIASLRIFQPKHMQETKSQLQIFSSSGSPNGIQGLLQYFNLVEGCLTLIKQYQEQNNFTYDWIIRTRVDGYWTAPLNPNHFIPGHYVVPSGSNYRGLNDRLGIGDLNTSAVALSRLTLIPKLHSAGYHNLNSERAFKAQLITQGVPYAEKEIPFCIVSDRRYRFPPSVPVVAISSLGPLSGAKCRPCTPVSQGTSLADVMRKLYKGWNGTDSEIGPFKLCDPRHTWQKGWEKVFDNDAGKQFADSRKRVSELKLKECVNDFEEMRKGVSGSWDAPNSTEICTLGLRVD